MKNTNKAFTLIEVIVSVSIFSIIMISIIAIYIVSSDTSIKSDINRAMQENLKSVITEMSEDIIKNGILGVSDSIILDGCDLSSPREGYKDGSTICLKSESEYFLASKDDVSGDYKIVDKDYCSILANQCFIVRKSKELEKPEPLTNSLVTVRDLNFYVTTAFGLNKVTINATFQPSNKGGIKPELIKESKIYFQTTISERPILTN